MENIAGNLLLVLRLMMALAIYGFLGWGLVILWRDLKQQGEILSRQRVPVLQVNLLNGARRERFRFKTPEVIIGRHPGCEWILEHETVSSQHARLLYHHDQWWLEDLDSRNGTYLNEEKITSPVVLANADSVRCGQLTFLVHIEEMEIGGRNG